VLLKIPFARVDCSGNELKYVSEVLQSGWLTTASKALAFEAQFAEKVGSKHACAVNSCTAALHLALEALGIGPGDSVFVPTMTFTATAEVVRYMGADPIFLDVEFGTNLVTPEILDKAAVEHPGTKAVMIVHFGGHPADMFGPDGVTGLLAVCKRHGIRIVEDAAHAFPASCGGHQVGSIGDITCFSFYANKTITTGEGGMLTTNDDAIAQRVRCMRLHGINRDVWDRFTSEKPSWEYDVVAPGFKYNMPDITAAVGLAQLEKAEELRQQRQQCAEFYLNELSDIPTMILPTAQCPMEHHAWHLFPVVLTPDASLGRNSFIEKIMERGIGMSVHYKPVHRMTYYRDHYKLAPGDFPNAERTWRGNASLPIFSSMTQEELAYISTVVHDLID